MKAPSLTDRLLEAITTEVQDAREAGTGETRRVQQRLDAMLDAMAIVEEHENYAATFAKREAGRGNGFRSRIGLWLGRAKPREAANG